MVSHSAAPIASIVEVRKGRARQRAGRPPPKGMVDPNARQAAEMEYGIAGPGLVAAAFGRVILSR